MRVRRSTRSTGGRGQAPPPVSALRRLVSLAVLVGFVAMHGLSADHDLHVLATMAGHSHATQSDAGTATAATAAAVPASAAVADAGTWLLVQARPPVDDAGGGHAEGCLLALTVGVLALALAMLAARGRGLGGARLLSHPGPLLSRRPPRPSAPCLFALGVLRT